ncbi:glycoside hydrolase family 36 protein [Paenibacillus montanisoli]|uniref:Alpha-galactosidase n=1 Tax=Paenibacillus montanisoli TaxID=2081970 RepID=A0A328TU89_9BACL|nr:glycoside hydrolase family 36 protein [Paenibacillus montanisoli]RAP74109.1 alpha-galactosidase [Paenibacillus montanisoli]
MAVRSIQAQAQVQAGGYTVTLEKEAAVHAFEVTLTASEYSDGVHVVHLRLAAAVAAVPPVLQLKWTLPIVDMHGLWHPGADRNRSFPADWAHGRTVKATSSAPVGCIYNNEGLNRHTFAFSDTLSPIGIKVGVHEETADFHCVVSLFHEPTAPIAEYEASLLLDTRELPYYDCLGDVSRWWASMKGVEPAFVPAAAREPMLSTWYSFHQRLTPEAIEAECALAKAIGCEAVIVDDGWQTSDNERGYLYCGDWEASVEKFPDMRAHVDRVHAVGMKYLLWYSVPFIGKKSRAWERFEGKLLYVNEELGAGVIDPRYPEAREYLIGLYEQAVREWDLDGLKLDFVDMFAQRADADRNGGEGMDYISVPAAADRLLTDVIGRLRELKPDILIEFRQSYVGPQMRKYGNIFRAADCPNDPVTNRIRTLDIRLLCGNTAAHADMIMWHVNEPVECAAMHLLNVLFAVPQISVRLDRIPEDHRRMLAYWLAFFRSHRETLLDGRLEPFRPELLYPLVRATSADQQIIAAYNDSVIPAGSGLPPELVVVNGTAKERLILEFEEALENVTIEVHNCMGEIVRREEAAAIGQGLYVLEVPSSGAAYLRRNVI